MTVYPWKNGLPERTGSRLKLRRLTDGDAPAVLAIFGDDEVMRYWSTPALGDLDAARKLIVEIDELFRARRGFQWGVCRLDTGDVLGTCTLWNPDWTHRRAEIGFAVARDSWGRGYAREALDLLIGFAFGDLGLHRLEADVDPRNARSLRLLERLGFRREGLLRERWHRPDEIQDSVMLGLLRREWVAERP